MLALRLYKRLPPRHRESVARLLSWLPFRWSGGPVYRRMRRFLAEAQNWPREKLDAWQLERLRALIRYSCAHTDGYRQLYREHGITADDIRTLSDVRHLPMTTKRLFQDNLEAFSVATPHREYVTTGGSTGIPFGFYQPLDAASIENAFMHTGWQWVGWPSRAISAVLRGAYIGASDRPFAYDPFRRFLLLSSYYLTPEHLPAYLAEIDRYRPAVLRAYPSSLLMFADLLKECAPDHRLPFRLVLLGSENVYDWQLARIREQLPGARFFSWYGSAEKVILAPWCAHREAYHCWPLYGLTEVLDARGEPVSQGEQGELVGTSFWFKTTPFIRYRTMDHAVKGPSSCADCGRPFELLEKIAGRAHEFIVTGGGRYISMTAINMHDDIFDSLRQFQFVQERRGDVTFRYVAKGVQVDLPRIRAGLQAKLGDDMRLSMQEVDAIPPAPSGKFRFLDQKLDIRYGDAP